MTLQESLRDHYVRQYPAEAARVVESADDPARELEQLSTEALTQLLEHIDPARLKPMLLALDDDRQAGVLQAASVRTVMLVLRALTDDEREAALNNLPQAVQTEYRELLEFPERTAGRYMDGLPGRYRSDQSVGEALAELRKSKWQRARSLYLVDENDVLAGRVDLQDNHPGLRVSLTLP